MNRITKERCRSGRSGRSRKPLCLRVPRVRIPVFPQSTRGSLGIKSQGFFVRYRGELVLLRCRIKKAFSAERAKASSHRFAGLPPPGSAQLIPPRARCKKYHLAQRGNSRKNRLFPSPISLLSHGPRNFFSYVFQGQTYIKYKRPKLCTNSECSTGGRWNCRH